MAKYKAYPEYKESGVEWLGEVPEHWEVAQLRRVVKSITNGTTETQVEFEEGAIAVSRIETISKGYIDFNRVGFINFQKKLKGFLLKKGDILFSHINSLSMIGNSAVYESNTPLIHGMNLLRVQACKDINSKWLLYLLTSPIINKSIESLAKPAINQASISINTLKSIKLPIPDVSERNNIVKFLDHETAKIDTLIEKQEKLIELLQEKRQAVISHAVTKGLDSSVAMKDSGVEWLGEVPEHWSISKIKHNFKNFNYVRIPLSAEERASRTGEFRYYGASGVIDYIDSYLFDGSYILVGEDGANLVSRSSPLSFAVTGKFWVNNHAHILQPSDLLVDYWAEVIEAIDFRNFITGSAQPKLTAEALGDLKIAYPKKLEERIEINNYLIEQKSTYDNTIEKSIKFIKLLKERRTALISAAVTGKIDVRDVEIA